MRCVSILLAVVFASGVALFQAGCSGKGDEEKKKTEVQAEKGLLERAGAATDSAIQKGVEATGKAVDKTEATAKKAYETTKEVTGKAVDKTREATGEGLKKAGELIKPKAEISDEARER